MNSIMKGKFYSILIGGLLFVSSLFAETKLITYPAPVSEKMSSFYSVSVNGQKIDLYKALSPLFDGGEYYFGYFDFEGKVDVVVDIKRREKVDDRQPRYKTTLLSSTIKNANILPRKVSFSADKPFNATIMYEERHMPLILFGNPIEKNKPSKDDPNVVYFGPGLHVRDIVHLKDGQTLYLEGGAVLKSQVIGRGNNISIRGRGIISGELIQRRMIGHLIYLRKCENVYIEGVIFKDSAHWTFALQNCNKVEIDNLKICCSRMINDDAIDICNTANVKIRNVFARAQDDIIAIKGFNGPACKNMVIENSTFWTDRANIFRIGYEGKAESMSNIIVRNIDIPFYSVNYRGPEEYWAKGIIWLQATCDMPMFNIHFENINIRSNGDNQCVLLANPRVVNWRDCKTAGKVYDCSIKNLNVWGRKGDFKGLLYFKGADETRSVKNITLENITYFGEKIDAKYPHFQDTKIHTSGVSIK